MKRSQLKRGAKPLRADPEKVRAWMAKSRARGGFRRHPPVPPEARKSATRRSHGRCIVCRKEPGRRGQLHHVLPKDDYPHLVQVEENLVLLCEGCHANHESAHRRVRRWELPHCCIELAYLEGQAALVYLENTYPERTGLRVEDRRRT